MKETSLPAGAGLHAEHLSRPVPAGTPHTLITGLGALPPAIPETALVPLRQPGSLLSPEGISALRFLGKALAASGYFADARQEAQAIVKVLAGNELGIGPIAAMMQIWWIKNKLTLSANLMCAIIGRSKLHKWRISRHDDKGCDLAFSKRFSLGEPWEEVGESVFTEEDARKANLLSNDNYKKFPRNMYFARAISNGAKWFCAELFGGQTPYLPDEIAPDAVRYDGDGIAEIEARVISHPTIDLRASGDSEDGDEGENWQTVEALLATTGSDEAALLRHYKVRTLTLLNPGQIRDAIRQLRGKLVPPLVADAESTPEPAPEATPTPERKKRKSAKTS